MSKIIAVNAGSSSLKYQVYQLPEFKVLASGQVERIGRDDAIVSIKANGNKDKRTTKILDHKEAVAIVLKDILEYSEISSLDEIVGVGHRIVHGGEVFKASVQSSPEIVDQVEKLSKLAPLHNPANLTGYYAFKKALKSARHVFVFDTAFHQTMEPKAYLYALPYEYYEKYHVRKYGMHGTSHKYVSKRTAELLGKSPEEVNVIVCHLGNGASLSAVKGGKVIDTSMGFTPLSGVMMGTRTGDVDPAVFPYLLEETGLESQDLEDVYNKQSGMLGISGISNDAREIEDATEANVPRAVLTSDMYAYKIASYIGSYLVHLGHVDAIAFTAGIGEYDKGVRRRIVENISEALGIDFDYDLNDEVRGVEVELTKPTSKTKVFIVPTDEELVIAQDTQKILGL
ncbi:MAG TPA: acetate kinase [Erysipelotrichaceae bacterium]|nr:acetate kinase [Erysipelotrichaceae bacterium]